MYKTVEKVVAALKNHSSMWTIFAYFAVAVVASEGI